MIEQLIAETGQVIGGALRPDELLGAGPGSLQAAIKAAVDRVTPTFIYVGSVLLIIGLVQALIRQSDAPRDLMSAITRVVALALLMSLCRTDRGAWLGYWRDFVPKVSGELAESLQNPEQKKDPLARVGHFVELIYPGGDLKAADVTAVSGTSRAGLLNFTGKIAEKVGNAITLAIRGLVALVIIAVSFVALFLGWLVGLVVVWLSEVLFLFGWMLVPMALGALAIESLRGIGSTYLLGLTSVGTGKLALGLAHVGTDALMRWVAKTLEALTQVKEVIGVTDTFPSQAIRQKFADALAGLPIGAWALLFLTVLILALWVVVTPIFAWKVFMSTLRTGAQFGSRLGFAFAGATLRAAGNVADVAGSALSANARKGSAKKEVAAAPEAGSSGSASANASAQSLPSPDRGGLASGREEAPSSPIRPKLSGEKLAAARQRVADAAARGRAAGKSDDEVELMCRSVAIQSGASAAEAAEIVRDVQGGTTDRAPAQAASATAPSPQASEASRTSEKAAAATDEPARPLPAAYALTLAAAALRRASAHANEAFPDPTDNGLVAAHQRAQPKPRENAS